MRLPKAAIVVMVLLSGAATAGPQVADSQSVANVAEEVCLECHDAIEDQMALPVAHPPARDGDCSACHNPHAGRHEALLLDRPAILCVSCHENLVAELQRPELHRPASEGLCNECHRPHGGPNENLLVAPGAQVCSTCHAAIESWQGLAVQHSPFRRGRCGDCHEPHGAEHAGLARQPGAETCLRCHPVSQKFRTDHRGFPVDKAECQQCHDPHASSRQGLFRPTLHPPFEDGECTDCHVGPRADDAFRLVESEGVLCGQCHEDQVEELKSAVFPHVGAAGGDCSTCHNPHSGEGAGLLRKDTQTLCQTCHDPAGASSGEDGLYSTHADLSCSMCHNGHGGPLPVLLVNEPAALCGSCHAHQHNITHPQGEDVLDQRNQQPLDCISCHSIHEAPYDNYLPRDGDRDLCVGCHTELAGPR